MSGNWQSTLFSVKVSFVQTHATIHWKGQVIESTDYFCTCSHTKAYYRIPPASPVVYVLLVMPGAHRAWRSRARWAPGNAQRTFFPMQPDPRDPAPGVDGSIMGYQVSVTGITPMSLTSSDLSYEVDVSGNNVAEYFVSVAAQNLLGLGTASTIGPFSEC